LLDDDEEDDLALRIMIDNFGMENDSLERRGPRGSRPKKRANIDRGREDGQERILKDYFGKDPVFLPKMFQRRYQMQRSLFLRIMHEVCAYDSYFV
jgi:hypothetical protein